jgi:hypothetical protein
VSEQVMIADFVTDWRGGLQIRDLFPGLQIRDSCGIADQGLVIC